MADAPLVITPIAHPTTFQTLEAKFVHGVSLAVNAIKQAPAECVALVKGGEAELLILAPGLAPFIPQINAAVSAEVKAFLEHLLAEFQAVEAIPVQPAA